MRYVGKEGRVAAVAHDDHLGWEVVHVGQGLDQPRVGLGVAARLSGEMGGQRLQSGREGTQR
jgi:hypothetical protein